MRDDEKRRVPAATVPRLALYLRKLRELGASGAGWVSSADLAALIDLNPAQIRKDLSYFGPLGRRGVGYEVPRLVAELTRCLGLDRSRNVVIVGAGLLGSALARYPGFADQGFRVVGVFDSAAAVIGTDYGGGRVRPVDELEEFCAGTHVDIAVVTVPASAAQATVDGLTTAGVRAVLNFAPAKVSAPPGVAVRPVDLSGELMLLSYSLAGAVGDDGKPS